MKTPTTAALLWVLTLAMIATSSVLAAERMQSGQWEMTSTSSDGRSHSITQCVTSQDAKSLNGTPAEMRAEIERVTAAAHGTVEDFKMQGDTVAYRIVSPGSSIDTSTSYHGNAYEMVMTSKAPAKAETTQVKARRVGSCP